MSNRTEQVMSNERIETLVRLAQEGDMDAFDELVQAFQRQMFNLAYRMVGNREDAADLTQEIFVKVYKSIRKFHGKAKFSTWLYAVAANTCRSGLRKLRRVSSREVVRLDAEQETDEGSYRKEAVDPGDLPDRELERKEMLQRIEQVVAELPEDFKMVIVLRDMRGLSYDEVAKALDCSIGTVKSRLARARTRVKDKLVRRGLKCAVKT